jgi:hypothetical protein
MRYKNPHKKELAARGSRVRGAEGRMARSLLGEGYRDVGDGVAVPPDEAPTEPMLPAVVFALPVASVPARLWPFLDMSLTDRPFLYEQAPLRNLRQSRKARNAG